MTRRHLSAVPDPDDEADEQGMDTTPAKKPRRKRAYRLRADGSRAYMVRFKRPDGSTGQETFDTAAAADSFRAQLREAKQLGQRAVDTRTAWPALAAEWGKHYAEHLEVATQAMHRENLVNRILPWFGDRRVAGTDEGTIDSFVEWMRRSGGVKECRRADGTRYGKWDRIPVDHEGRKPAGAATIRKTLQTLQLMCARAVKQKMLPANPVTGAKRPKETPREGRAATLLEIQALMIAAPTERDRAFIVLAPYSGMRLGELRALQWSDIDWNGDAEWADGWINLWRAARRDGSIKRTKTNEPVRRIPIFARAELERWRELAPSRRGMVFTDRNGNVMNPDNWRSDVWVPTKQRASRWLEWELASQHELGAEWMRAAGDSEAKVRSQVERWATEREALVGAIQALDFHEFGRHTFVSLCAASGIPMLVAMGFSGHESPATWKKYKHHFSDESKRHARALREWLVERGH